MDEFAQRRRAPGNTAKQKSGLRNHRLTSLERRRHVSQLRYCPRVMLVTSIERSDQWTGVQKDAALHRP